MVVQSSLEAADIEFIPENGGGLGVRLKEDMRRNRQAADGGRGRARIAPKRRRPALPEHWFKKSLQRLARADIIPYQLKDSGDAMMLRRVFEPIRIGNVEAPNRLVRAGHGTHLPRHAYDEDSIAYHTRPRDLDSRRTKPRSGDDPGLHHLRG